jgi:hypothetical protein
VISRDQIIEFCRQISEDDELKPLFSTIPEGTTVPYRKSPVDLFFATTFALRSESISLSNLALVCESIVRRFVDAGLAEGLKAVSVLVCAQVGEEFQRVLRFAVYDTAFKSLPRLSPHELLRNEPAEGITCGWYWDRSNVPTD